MVRKPRKRDKRSKPWKESAIREIYTDYARNARKRDRVFDITEEYLKELIQKNCEYCGAPPTNEKRARGKNLRAGEVFLYSGIDRKDSSLGYIEGNVVPCCSKCNQIKTNLLSFREMVAVAKLLKKL